MKPTSLPLTLLLLLSLLTLTSGVAGAAIAGSPHAPAWDLAPPGERLSTGLGADIPRIVPFPDGQRLLAVFNQWVTGQDDRDPYYTLFAGESWSAPAPIYESAGVDSGNVAVAVDDGGRAHAVWSEPGAGIYYARRDGDGWRAPQIVSLAGGTLYLAPAIATRGADIVHVVWGQNQPPQAGNPSIYYSHSTDGGDSWSPPAAVGGAPTAPTSLAPALAVDGAGTVHVVWQETFISGGDSGYRILYSNNESGWVAPLSLSPGLPTGEQPNILIDSRVHVTFTSSDTVAGERAKWIYYTACAATCSQAGQWREPLNISVTPVGVNESDPFWSISALGRGHGCTYVFFYGFTQPAYTREQIWNINSCDGWNGGGRDPVTGSEGRGLYPNVAFAGESVHLVYEFVSGSEHQVYYLPGRLGPRVVYLPALAGKGGGR